MKHALILGLVCTALSACAVRMEARPDDELRALTDEFRDRVAQEDTKEKRVENELAKARRALVEWRQQDAGEGEEG